MSWKPLLGALGANLLYFNASVLLLELAARTVSLSFHVGGSALTVFLFVVALLLVDRLEIHPLAASLVLPVGLLGAFLAVERTAPPAVPFLVFAIPFLVMDVPLLRSVARAPSLGVVATLLVAMPVLAFASVVLERKLDAREAARLEAERAVYLAAREQRLAELRNDPNGACELFASDPTADFERCRTCFANARDVRERWRQIGFFFPPGLAHRMKPDVGTPDERGWILEHYARTWTELPDADVLERVAYVREALAQVRAESSRALSPELRASMVDRLESCLRAGATKSERAQAEATIAFLRELD